MKTREIEIIRGKLGIGYAVISRYNSEHKEEIEQIKDLFLLKGDSKEKVLALFYMFSSGKEDDAIKKYREQTGMSNENFPSENLLEQYKVLLITALVYNKSFYNMAVNYRGFVEAGLNVGEADEDSLDFTYSEPTEQPDGKPARRPFFSRKFPGTSKRIAAGVVAAAACLLIVFSSIGLLRIFNTGLGPQITDAWISDFIAYSPVEDTDRLTLLMPLTPSIKGGDTGAGSAGTESTAIKQYDKAIRADKNNAELYIQRGIALTLGGYFESAVKDFDMAIELDPKNASAYYNRAIANAGRDIEIDAIIADLMKVLEINPGDTGAYFAIGVFYSRQYLMNKTKASLESAINALERIPSGDKDTETLLEYLKDMH